MTLLVRFPANPEHITLLLLLRNLEHMMPLNLQERGKSKSPPLPWPDDSADLPDYAVTAADTQLDSHDHVDSNPGAHLSGDIANDSI